MAAASAPVYYIRGRCLDRSFVPARPVLGV